MRLLLTTGLLVMFAPTFAVAQRGNTHAMLTRAEIRKLKVAFPN
jgi:hypothetical protein